MKVIRLIAITLLFSGIPSLAGDLQKQIKNEWLGSWVLVTPESRSDCGDLYTDNRVNGRRVRSGGSVAFEPGELAKVDKVDVKRERVDVLLTLHERMLLPFPDGPFTLYENAKCLIEFEIVLPRQTVKAKDVSGVTERIEQVLERFASADQARESSSWNRREVKPYPNDYENTLARHAAWKAERANAEVQAKIEYALEETTRVVDRLEDTDAYATGFAHGAQVAKDEDLHSCPDLLSMNLREIRRDAEKADDLPEDAAKDTAEGFGDGQVLVYGLIMIRDLPGCFVPVPQIDTERIE